MTRTSGRTRTCNLRFWRPPLCQLSYKRSVYARQDLNLHQTMGWPNRFIALLYLVENRRTSECRTVVSSGGGRVHPVRLSGPRIPAFALHTQYTTKKRECQERNQSPQKQEYRVSDSANSSSCLAPSTAASRNSVYENFLLNVT